MNRARKTTLLGFNLRNLYLEFRIRASFGSFRSPKLRVHLTKNKDCYVAKMNRLKYTATVKIYNYLQFLYPRCLLSSSPFSLLVVVSFSVANLRALYHPCLPDKSLRLPYTLVASPISLFEVCTFSLSHINTRVRACSQVAFRG
jgi:hypothetical protein